MLFDVPKPYYYWLKFKNLARNFVSLSWKNLYSEASTSRGHLALTTTTS